MSEEMSEDLSIGMVGKMSKKNVRKNVWYVNRKGCQKIWQKRMSEEMLEDMSKKDIRKFAYTALAMKACLLGCNSATLNIQVTLLYLAIAISALAGGDHLKFSYRNPSFAGVFVFFRTVFGRWIWRGYWDGIWCRFGGVPATEKRTWEASGNGKTDNNEKKIANTYIFLGFGILEYWIHCKNQCFGPILYWKTRKLRCFWRKDWNNIVRYCKNLCFGPILCPKIYKLCRYWKKKIEKYCKTVIEAYSISAVWAVPHTKRGEYVRKGRQKICPKKCHKERLYWTIFIELQAPRCLKTDVATAILA